MTTKELLKKAHKIASKYFDVESIYINQTFHVDENKFSFDMTCFYWFKGKMKNFSTNRWVYSIEDLISIYKTRTKEEAKKLYPKPESLQTTDLDISEPEKTADNETN